MGIFSPKILRGLLIPSMKGLNAHPERLVPPAPHLPKVSDRLAPQATWASLLKILHAPPERLVPDMDRPKSRHLIRDVDCAAGAATGVLRDGSRHLS